MNRLHEAKLSSVPSALMTAAEVGARLRLPLSTVYYLANSGKLPSIQLGRSWRFPATAIEELAGGTGCFPRHGSRPGSNG